MDLSGVKVGKVASNGRNERMGSEAQPVRSSRVSESGELRLYGVRVIETIALVGDSGGTSSMVAINKQSSR